MAAVHQPLLTELIAQCRGERLAYQTSRETSSPACIEIFRRAFAGSEEAWAAIHDVVSPLLQRWAQTDGLVEMAGVIEPSDIMQHALTAFSRIDQSVANKLLTTSDLAPVLAYLRTIVKRLVIRLIRRQRRQTYIDETGDIQPIITISLEDVVDLPSLATTGVVDLPGVAVKLCQKVTKSGQEQIVFQSYFVDGMKPKEILKHYGDQFTEKELRQHVQNINRRTRKILEGLFVQQPQLLAFKYCFVKNLSAEDLCQHAPSVFQDVATARQVISEVRAMLLRFLRDDSPEVD